MSSIRRLPRQPVMAGPFWSVHTHSRYSANDALPAVQAIVDRAEQLGYPALGLTDHGNPSGSVELYKACRKVDIEPLPGIELYVVHDTEYAGRKDNLHLTVNAYTDRGYRNLMRLATRSAERFWYKPRVDFADFAAMAEDGLTEGLAVSTGCFFGVLPQVLMHQGEAAALQVLYGLASWFPRVYVELQNHGIDEHHGGEKAIDITDDELLERVYALSQRAGLPCVVTRDSHYVDAGDRPLHEGLKQLVSWSEDTDDAVFPGGGYFMTDTAGMKPFFEPHILAAGLEGLTDLAAAAHVRIPDLEHFSLKIPEVTPGRDPMVVLEELVEKAYAEIIAASPQLAHDQRYADAVEVELRQYRHNGMAAYIVLVWMVCEFMREHGISFHARGSAAGSVINWLLGITQVDPIRFGLRFDRFMSNNRMKPPDVDLDVEHARRDEVIAFAGRMWAICSIGSHAKYSLWDSDEGDDQGGSLRVRYYSVLRKKGVEPPKWSDLPPGDLAELKELAKLKLISGYGTHAAGYIIAPTQELIDDLPMWWQASSKKFVTAYGKKSVELLGFLKLDLLGLRTRTAIRVMCELAGIDFEDIPDGDKTTYKEIGRGRTTGVFQLDGYTMRRGCQQLQPKNIYGLMAAQALFRPAAINSGATEAYLDRQRGVEAVPHRHDDIMVATAETFGVMLYQEQVMDVMETLGLDSVELEEMLDAVKASNEYSIGAAAAIAGKLPRIRALAEGRGWTNVDIDWLLESLEAYAEYSFNKAHAASYAVVAYRTAYMRVHHPNEFWTGMLQAYADSTKPKGKPHKTVTYITAARREDGVKVYGVHVNRSKATFTLDSDRGGIRKGFSTVRGVGAVAAKVLEAKAPYASLTDLGQRHLPKQVTGAGALALKKAPQDCGGIITALDDVGALEGLEHEDGNGTELDGAAGATEGGDRRPRLARPLGRDLQPAG